MRKTTPSEKKKHYQHTANPQGMHYEQKLMIASVLIMLVASFLFISRELNAQQGAAVVSARVEATPYNTRIRQKTFIDSLTPYQKITIGSIGLLMVSGGTAVYLAFGSKKKPHAA